MAKIKAGSKVLFGLLNDDDSVTPVKAKIEEVYDDGSVRLTYDCGDDCGEQEIMGARPGAAGSAVCFWTED